MTELAYMIRSDWAQHGTAMGEQSAKIRAWLGEPPFIFFTPRLARFNDRNSADREFAEFVAPDDATRHVFEIGELADVRNSDGIDSAVTIIHPFEPRDCERLLEAVSAKAVARMFVMVWSEMDRVRVMLDALDAVDLHAGGRAHAPDAVQLEAARLMVDEQYNGLSSGRGKDAVIQLLRAFREEGTPSTSVRGFMRFTRLVARSPLVRPSLASSRR